MHMPDWERLRKDFPALAIHIDGVGPTKVAGVQCETSWRVELKLAKDTRGTYHRVKEGTPGFVFLHVGCSGGVMFIEPYEKKRLLDEEFELALWQAMKAAEAALRLCGA